MENVRGHKNDREGEKNSSLYSGGESRGSFLLVMEQEIGVKLEARRMRCAVIWQPQLTHYWEGVVFVKTSVGTDGHHLMTSAPPG